VSIVIPVYNATRTIATHVGACSAQNYPDVEVIVVDDGSEGDIGALLKTWASRGIRSFRHNQPRGASAVRNSGVAIAKGEGPYRSLQLWLKVVG
jgi:glycosyltransferase involved in cell wall biosynthesis